MSPFVDARTLRISKGLEIRVVKLSELENSMTIGSEYYGPSYSVPVDLLRSSTYELPTLADVCTLITDGDHGSAEYAPQGIPFVLSEAVREGWVDMARCRFITAEHAKKLQRSTLREGDVLVTKTGVYFGKSALVDKALAGANTIAHVGLLRLKKDSEIVPAYLSTFLNSKYGQAQLRRRGIKATRPEIKLSEFSDILVPRLSLKLQEIIEGVIGVAKNHRTKATRATVDAAAELVAGVGLAIEQSDSASYSERLCSDAFGAGRLDAEYFQPRFTRLLDQVRATGRSAMLGDWLMECQRGKQPQYSEEGLPVVNSKHVLRDEVLLDEDNRVAAFEEDDLLIHAGDVLVNGTGVGTIGRAAPYLHSDSAIPDNHVTVLRPRRGLDSVYLSVFLNSVLGQWQVEQRLRGSSGQIEIYPADLSRFEVWLAPTEIQRRIRGLIERGFSERRMSTEKLSLARRAVEVAIEDSEAAAMKLLKGAA